jgi:hypothetical protein
MLLNWQNRLKFNQIKPGGRRFWRFLVLQSGHLRTLYQGQLTAHNGRPDNYGEYQIPTFGDHLEII